MTKHETIYTNGLINMSVPVEEKYNVIPSKDIMPKLAKMFGIEDLKIRTMDVHLDYGDVCEVTVVFLADERAKE